MNVPGGENTRYSTEGADTISGIKVDGYISAVTQGAVTSVYGSVDGVNYEELAGDTVGATMTRYNVHGLMYLLLNTSGVGHMSLVA